MNQTTMMYQVAQNLLEYDQYFTAYYGDGEQDWAARNGLIDSSILAGNFKRDTENFIREKGLQMDYRGEGHDYDLVVTCSDLIVQKNIRNKKIVLVQEGMMVPDNWITKLVKTFHLPHYLANTSMTGMSLAYEKFCVASEGFADFFVKKGIPSERIAVTGMPNFDDVLKYRENDFPHRDYVLAATSANRETFVYENRKKSILTAKQVAEELGKPLLFKTHPNENQERAVREFEKYAPGSIIYTSGNTNEIIANCAAMVTRFSSVLLVASALDKPVYSELDMDFVKSLKPIQNEGTSAVAIADICREYLTEPITI
ncbi:MAG: hypothetical protein AB8G22_26460 [Saprospiraceae bacterium]